MRLFILLISCCLALSTTNTWADRDHEQARAAVQSGQIQSLQVLLTQVERDYPGVFLEAELEKDEGIWVYEIKILQASGQRIKLKVNASTGDVLQPLKRKP